MIIPTAVGDHYTQLREFVAGALQTLTIEADMAYLNRCEAPIM